jgi:hypothetical protein
VQFTAFIESRRIFQTVQLSSQITWHGSSRRGGGKCRFFGRMSPSRTSPRCSVGPGKRGALDLLREHSLLMLHREEGSYCLENWTQSVFHYKSIYLYIARFTEWNVLCRNIAQMALKQDKELTNVFARVWIVPPGRSFSPLLR